MPSNLKRGAVKVSHICKWKRHTYETGSKIFFCTLPKCSKKLKLGLALGKECICWRCGDVFIMNEYSIRLAKPHCEDCHKSKEDIKVGPIHTEVIGPLDYTPPNSLIERLKQATQVNGTKINEDEEEI